MLHSINKYLFFNLKIKHSTFCELVICTYTLLLRNLKPTKHTTFPRELHTSNLVHLYTFFI